MSVVCVCVVRLYCASVVCVYRVLLSVLVVVCDCGVRLVCAVRFLFAFVVCDGGVRLWCGVRLCLFFAVPASALFLPILFPSWVMSSFRSKRFALENHTDSGSNSDSDFETLFETGQLRSVTTPSVRPAHRK